MVKGLLFSYPGSKWRLAPQYHRLYPPHQVFVDLFGGSGAMIARQEPHATEVYNDLDESVTNVFVVVKHAAGCKQVLRLLDSTSNDREQYEVCRKLLADPNESNVRRAWAFMVCGTIGFAVHPALANGWTLPENQRRDLVNLPAKVQWWHHRLQQVRLENRPWQEIVDLYDSPSTFFFNDPPYLAQVLRSANQYYRHGMGQAEHIELIERLRTIQGHALICAYNHPLYTERLFHWRRVTLSARETMGSKHKGKRLEVAWLNYEDDGSKIEGTRLRIAQRYVTIMGGEEEAVRYVERIKRLKRLRE